MDNEPLRFARLAIATARRVVPPRLSPHAGPIYHPASLLAALLLKEHLRPTYRGVEDLLGLTDRLRRRFGLRIVPDHSTLWWFGRRHLTPGLLAAALEETVARAAGRLRGPRLVALDSTGLWLARASRYFEWRARRGRGQRGWLKWALALWVEPQMLVAQRVRPGPAGDFGDLVPLAATARAVLPFERLSPTPGTTARATTASAARNWASTASSPPRSAGPCGSSPRPRIGGRWSSASAGPATRPASGPTASAGRRRRSCRS